MRVRVRACVRVWTCVYACEFACVCMCLCECVCRCECVFVCMCALVCEGVCVFVGLVAKSNAFLLFLSNDPLQVGHAQEGLARVFSASQTNRIIDIPLRNHAKRSF